MLLFTKIQIFCRCETVFFRSIRCVLNRNTMNWLSEITGDIVKDHSASYICLKSPIVYFYIHRNSFIKFIFWLCFWQWRHLKILLCFNMGINRVFCKNQLNKNNDILLTEHVRFLWFDLFFFLLRFCYQNTSINKTD